MLKKIRPRRPDQLFQGMVIRETEEESMRHYAMTTLAFGAELNPYQAQTYLLRRVDNVSELDQGPRIII